MASRLTGAFVGHFLQRSSYLVSDGNVGVAIAPVLAIGLVYLLWKVPVRYPMLALLFLGLAIETPADLHKPASRCSPLETGPGSCSSQRWNSYPTGASARRSGMDHAWWPCFIGIAWYRRATGSRIDRQGPETASPLGFFYVTAVVGAWFSYGWGPGRARLCFRPCPSSRCSTSSIRCSTTSFIILPSAGRKTIRRSQRWSSPHSTLEPLSGVPVYLPISSRRTTSYICQPPRRTATRFCSRARSACA